MKTFLLAMATLSVIALPAAADAAQCRDSATGKFAKCDAPGAVPTAQYVAKGKTAAKAKTTKSAAAPAPAATANSPSAAKPGLMSMFKAKPKPAPTATKAARCKTDKGKFVKCGTPGAIPA